MESTLERLPEGSRVAIVRLRSLGDCVLTTPALTILKQFRPDLQVAVVVEDRFRAIFEGNPDVVEILAPAWGALGRWHPRLCLNFHGGTRSAFMTAISGARDRAGFRHYRHQFAYNQRIPRAQEILGVGRKVHTAEHLASAMFYLGAPACEIPRAKLVAQRGPVEGAYAVLHPFAATPRKTWRADGFMAVARHLRQSGLEPLFIGGPGDDLSPFQDFLTKSRAPLSEIKQILSAATLFVGNDSGPAHMAAAFGVPVVVIFGDSDREIWGPWRTQSAVVSAKDGISQVKTSEVLDALARLRVPA